MSGFHAPAFFPPRSAARLLRVALNSIFVLIVATGAARAQAPVEKPLSFTLPGPGQPVVLTADRLDWDRKTNRLTLACNVNIVSAAYSVKADQAIADLERGVIDCFGDVTVTVTDNGVPREVIKAREVALKVDSGGGVMLDVKVVVPWGQTELKVDAERVEKVDEDEYRVDRGEMTWCKCQGDEPPDWSIEAEKMNVTVDDQVTAENATIKLRDHPFFTLPYFQYPIGSGRRSGFLSPLLETSSSSGVQLETPYYLVLGPSADLTIGPRWIEKRGIDTGIDFRYNLGPTAAGELRGFAIDDAMEGQWRDGVKLTHRSDFGDRATIAADVAVISDNEVLTDFDHRQLGKDDQLALESRIVLARHWPFMNLTTEFSTFDDLMGGDVRKSRFGPDRDSAMVQRLPTVSYTLLTRRLAGPLYFDVSGQAVNYYVAEDPLGDGQMASLFPRLALATRLGDAVDFWASAGYREWWTIADPAPPDDQVLAGRVETEIQLSSQWERFFKTGDRRYRDSIRPSIVAFHASDPDYGDADFFQRVLPAAAVGLVGVRLEDRIWSRPDRDGATPISESARTELTQLYDLEAGEWRDLRLETRFGPPTPWRVNVDTYYSLERSELSKLSATVGYDFWGRALVSAGYRWNSGHVRSPYFEFESLENEALLGGFTLHPDDRNLIDYRVYYSLEYNMVVRQTLEWDHLARQRCWALNLRLSDRIKPTDPNQAHEVSGSVNLRVAAPGAP